MCPKEGTGFTTLIAQVKFDIFYLVGIDNGAFLCPTFMSVDWGIIFLILGMLCVGEAAARIYIMRHSL